MNKDFSKKKLLSFDENKQIRILYDLANFIENNQEPISSNHFLKLSKYHDYLSASTFDRVQKLNKEFIKIKDLGYQFQVYLMNLERLLGQSKKEYDFLVSTQDSDPLKTSQKTIKFPIVCLLDSIRSAHNVGAMFRNAECFGVSKIVLCGLTPTPDNKQVLKTAMGCEKNVDWDHHISAIEVVQNFIKDGYTIWAVETSRQSVNLNSLTEIPAKLVIIFGHEQFGVSLNLIELSDEIISIPTYGVKNSLNVSCGQAVTLNQLIHLANKNLKG
jgi:23S rRNA (guanosine2251-2'-O)-methyltransferase